MPTCQGRLWALRYLLALFGMVFLSAVTLYEFRSNTPNNRLDHSYPQGSSSSRRALESPNVKTGALRPARNPFKLHWCAELQYLQPARYPTALASFPGSGNTWLRYLLQQATGIYTGSVYEDYGLQINGFPAESVSNGSVLVIKTHEWGPRARERFQRAVLLVRAPAQAIQAEFNRLNSGHFGFASLDKYKRTKHWQQFVQNNLSSWRQFNLDWLYNFTGPIHVLFYDKLVNNVEENLKNLLNFLEYPVSQKKLSCALNRKEGIYRRRRKRVLNFDPYSSQMKNMLEEEQDKLYKIINTIIGQNSKR